MSGAREIQDPSAPGGGEAAGLFGDALPEQPAPVPECRTYRTPEQMARDLLPHLFEGAGGPDLGNIDGLAQRRKGGRPQGRPNDTTIAFRDYIAREFGHPGQATAMFGTWQSIEQFTALFQILKAKTGASAEACLGFMERCNTRILNKFVGDAPTQLNIAGSGRIVFQIGAGTLAPDPDDEPPPQIIDAVAA